MMLSLSMAKIENAAKDAVMSDDIIERIAEAVALSDQLMKPTAFSVFDQVYSHVQDRLAEELFFLVEHSCRPVRLNMSPVNTDLNARKITIPT